ARVAAGDGVAAVSLAAPGGWDYAAGHALLRAAGGVLIDQDGKEVTYTPDGRSATTWCFGGAPAAGDGRRQRHWQEGCARRAGAGRRSAWCGRRAGGWSRLRRCWPAPRAASSVNSPATRWAAWSSSARRSGSGASTPTAAAT